MGKRGGALVGLVGVALVVAFGVWLLTSHDATGEDAAGTPDQAASAAAAPSSTSLPSAPRAAEAAPLLAEPASTADAATPDEQSADSPAILSGTLLHDDDGTPVPDAEILVFATITGPNPRALSRIGARTAADGAFRVEFDHPVRIWLVQSVPGDGHARVDLRPKPELPIALGETGRVDLRAPRGTVVRGQVLDDAQRPVSQASVLAWCDFLYNVESGEGPLPQPDRRTVCDSAGRFELGGLGPQLVLMPEAPGLATKNGVAGSVAEGAVVNDVTLVLEPAVEVRGRVVDESGQPVSKVWVKASRQIAVMMPQELQRTTALKVVPLTDTDGRFTLAPLAARSWQVSVQAQGFAPWGKSVTPDGSELLIQLTSGLGLSGVVLGADGAPVADADVVLNGASSTKRGERGGSTAAQTTAEGQFTFGGLVPTETAVLGVSAAGHAVVVVEPVIVSDDATAPLEIRLEAERIIGGRVVDEHDQPLSGAAVEVHGDRSIATGEYFGVPWEDWFWPRVSSTVSDADGRFHLARLYDGQFELIVEDPRHPGLKHKQSLRSGVDDLLIRLDPALLRRSVIRGSVRDAVTGAPIDDFGVWLAPRDGPASPRGTPMTGDSFADAAGLFVLEGLDAGHWTLMARADDYANTTIDDLELHDGEQQLEVLMQPARSLHFRVVDREGEPVARAFVHFEDGRGQRIQLTEQPQGENTLGMTDRSGELTAHGLPADRISIVLKVRLVPDSQVGSKTVRIPIDLRVQPEGLQVYTVDQPHARCLVLAFNETAAAVSATVFDVDDPSTIETLKPLSEKDELKSVAAPITVTVTDADGATIDTARCAPNPQLTGGWSVSSSVCSSEGEPTSWLAVALPAGPSRVTIEAVDREPVTLDLPAGGRDDHLSRLVLLRPKSP